MKKTESALPSSHSRLDNMRRLLMLRVDDVRSRLTTPVIRRVWRLLILLSLVGVGLSAFFAWETLRFDDLHFAPRYLMLAVGIYILTYCQRLLGWHAIATYFFGRLPFRANAQAVAASSLVKFLPTIAWYIANRVHFYGERQIPRRTVVAASLFEVIAMLVSGGLLYVLFWAGQRLSFVALLVPLFLVALILGLGPLSWLPASWREWISIHTPALERGKGARRYAIGALFWYAGSWIGSVFFFWAVLRTLIPLQHTDLPPLTDAWFLANLVSYAVSLSFGTIPAAREVTLTVLVARLWPLPIALAATVLVKILFTVGEIGCSAICWALLYLSRERARHE